MFVVVEGIDGSGTATVSKEVALLLGERGHKVCWTNEPCSTGPIGSIIRSILRDEVKIDRRAMLGLFIADSWWNQEHVIKPSLDSDKYVICDRYAYSTWVYQQDLCDPSILRALMGGMLAPDKVYVLDVPVSIAQARKAHQRRELFDDRKAQEYYRSRYQNLVAYPEYAFRLGQEGMVILNAEENSASDIAHFILSQISE